MCDENDQIGEEEFLLRRFPPVRDYYNPSANPPISVIVFRPFDDDTDGLSLYRAGCCTVSELARAHAKPNKCYIVSLNARDIYSLGLSIRSDPQPGPKGHCIIPELSISNYKSNKLWGKEILLKLAKLASNNVLYTPESSF